MVYNDVLNEWLCSKDNIKLQTRLTYQNKIDCYLKESIGIIQMNDLNSEIIIEFFNSLDNLSIASKRTLIYVVRSSLAYAYNRNYTNYIDLKYIKFKLRKRNIVVLTKEEQIILEKELKKDPNIRKICILLCLYTGLRLGEVCGLKWEDINFSNKSLTVNRTILRIKKASKTYKTRLIESSPKTDTSNRIIPIPDFIIKLLKPYKKSGFILSDHLYDPRSLESCYERILRKCHIEHNKFHTLRHTFATRCIESKMDIKTLSEILGHANIETTLKLYVHPSYDLKRKSIENLVKYMRM